VNDSERLAALRVAKKQKATHAGFYDGYWGVVRGNEYRELGESYWWPLPKGNHAGTNPDDRPIATVIAGFKARIAAGKKAGKANV
jgi:hypothetical protein